MKLEFALILLEIRMLKPLAVQLYSLREQAEKDFVGVLKKVADIGYKGIETAGLWGLRPTNFKKIIDDLGLQLYSSHSPCCARPDILGEAMDVADILGLKKIICGYLKSEFQDLDSIKRIAEMTNKMQEILVQNGFILVQHNHYYEFEKLNGKLKYEIYAELCPNVKFEFDAFWATNFGQENVIEMLNLFADRIIMIHIKDGLLKKADTSVGTLADLRPLGMGELDIKAIFANMPQTVESIIVELDYCNIDMMTAIEQSYQYMVENGLTMGNK